MIGGAGMDHVHSPSVARAKRDLEGSARVNEQELAMEFFQLRPSSGSSGPDQGDPTLRPSQVWMKSRRFEHEVRRGCHESPLFAISIDRQTRKLLFRQTISGECLASEGRGP
jgi:hypothetical protein